MTIDSIQFNQIYISINGYAIDAKDFGDADIEITNGGDAGETRAGKGGGRCRGSGADLDCFLVLGQRPKLQYRREAELYADVADLNRQLAGADLPVGTKVDVCHADFPQSATYHRDCVYQCAALFRHAESILAVSSVADAAESG